MTEAHGRAAPALPDLPVLAALPALHVALAESGCAVLAAPPGSGKTTCVPLALLDARWLADQRIVMLEPRRIAARASAARMAALLGEAVGATVGYQVRFERRVSAATRIEVVTEGLLARRLQSDPELAGTGLLIFDEFHERSLDADLALALALDVRANLRPDLRLLVMSATLEAQRVARLLLPEAGAPLVEASGRVFPVEVSYAPPRAGVELPQALASAALAALSERPGDVLAFLPGAREIRAAQMQVESRLAAGSAVDVLPLYGDLSSAEQDAALRPAQAGRRKIVLATNLAQTSLTIEGVTTVIDAGLARVARFDLGAGANRLETQRVSRAAAEQRAGRAGRLGPGVAIRLWSRDEQAQRAAHDTPEILAADLTRFALDVAAWGVREVATLALLDAPPAAAWAAAQSLLRGLEALDSQGRITAHGRALLRFPAAPRIAHLLTRADARGLGTLACWIAAVLEERALGTDLATEAARFRQGRGTDPAAQRRVRDAVRQLQRLMRGDELAIDRADSSDEEAALGALVALAYPERIARRREAQTQTREIAYLCADGGEARLPQGDALAAAEWLAIAHWEPARESGGPRRIRTAARFDEAALRCDHADRIETRDEVHWNPRSEAVTAERQERLGALVLSRRPLREGAEPLMRAAAIEGIRALGPDVALPWTEIARQWQARVSSLRAWRPEEDWPDVSDAALAATLESWLSPHLDGVTRREHFARLDLVSILEARLSFEQRRDLARLAPTHLVVPSGSRLALEYAADGASPVLAVKLQELFGLTRTPTVDDGRRPVSLHLLSPGKRPIQVTRDLAGFWARTYPEVKKELKGRYPKHPWPDDPLSAPPTARAKPRR